MDLRPLVRYLAERLPKVAPSAVRFRILLHLVVGNPLQALVVLAGLHVWWSHDISFRWVLAMVAALWLLLELHHRLTFTSGGLLVGWREAWRIRRRWPSDWAAVAAKTARVQAEVGTSREPVVSAVLRPVADHPKMSWLPQIEWPVVSWWVGPPPGRSLAALDELTTVLAANISHASDVRAEYDRENDSHGRLIVSFDDVLARPSSPGWRPRTVETVPVDELGDGLGAAIDFFDRDEQPTFPPLRVIEGEAGR